MLFLYVAKEQHLLQIAQ
jgi:hypothetical protein